MEPSVSREEAKRIEDWQVQQRSPTRAPLVVERLAQSVRALYAKLDAQRLAADRVQRVGQDLLDQNKKLREVLSELVVFNPPDDTNDEAADLRDREAWQALVDRAEELFG